MSETNNVYIAVAVVAILTLAIGAFNFIQVSSLNQKLSNSDNAAILAKLSQMDSRLSVLESGSSSKTGGSASNVSMKFYYELSDNFQSSNVLRIFPTIQANLLKQGVNVDLEDVSSREKDLISQGVHSLPGLFISSTEAAAHPSLKQQLDQSAVKLADGYYLDAYALSLTGFRTILANQTCNANGKPLLMEFSDFECPYCKQIASSVKKMVNDLNGSLGFQFKNFPLDASCNSQMTQTLHPNACAAAIAGQCAKEQGKFSGYHDLLMSASSLSNATYYTLAAFGGLNMDNFSKCMASPIQPMKKIQQDIADGIKYEVPGTPTFLVDCKYEYGATTLAELKQYTCTATQGICSPE